MYNFLFIFGLGIFLFFILKWGFTSLTQEQWQIFASIPITKNEDGTWQGINLTYYGFFNACAYSFGIIIISILLGSINIQLSFIVLLSAIILLICVPASKIIAQIVENKPNTFTVGGASFFGIVVIPWIIFIFNIVLNRFNFSQIPVISFLSAVSIGYALGEGIGRLACISFGCCYGKPLNEAHPFFQKLFKNLNFVFYGKTKKIAYSSNLDCQPVIPIQAIVSIIFVFIGTIGAYLFLEGFFTLSFFLTLCVTQITRIFSEFLRSDFRGEMKFSAYQIMALISLAYSFLIVLIFKAQSIYPNIINGINILWSPSVILSIVILWNIIFVYTGKSMVTGSKISIYVHEDRI
ncbi:MAG: prolipoprotein diacylglyceryl transferase [Desulfobacterales bacterium]|nr:prolipoprotein diacylglyceryl transferase [Desulfobacterales bacterium]